MPENVAIQPLKSTKLFEPIKVGHNHLAHRLVYVPTTRFRNLENHVPSDLQVQYYDDRSKFPGTLIITEATVPTEHTGTFPYAPGIFNDEQAEAWKHINERIHANKSFSSIQLLGYGRVADVEQNKIEGQKLKGPSAIYHDEEQERTAKEAQNELEAYTTEEVDAVIEEYAVAAKRAVEAGFDYVELHAAHGYLINQFFESSSNQRTDKYGGSIENRSRFALNLIDSLIEAIGAHRVAIRISPWAKHQGMKTVDDKEAHPIATYGYFLGQLQQRAKDGKEIAYVSLVEPRVDGIETVEEKDQDGNNDFAKVIWKGILLRAGNYTYDAPAFKQVLDDVDDGRTLIGFSRYFTSNPDLVQRLHDGASLTPYDRQTFYSRSNWGYNTYSSLEEKRTFDEEAEKARQPAPVRA